MIEKNFKIPTKDIKWLLPKAIGGCLATDKITVAGELVEFMYRERPDFKDDSGWRFLSGTESQNYADDANNWAVYDVNTIANYGQTLLSCNSVAEPPSP